MNHTPIFDERVPIIGEPLKIRRAYVTAVVECQCEAKELIVLIGKDVIGTCPGCGRQFAIASSSSVSVGLVVQRDSVEN